VTSRDPLDPEDDKLVTLARGARERIRATQASAVRDDTGRTYVAADALMPSLPLAATAVVAAQAWVSGARGLEMVVIVTENPESLPDFAPLVDIGGVDVPVIVCGVDGGVVTRTTTGAASAS
jgi:hypothetical protein